MNDSLRQFVRFIAILIQWAVAVLLAVNALVFLFSAFRYQREGVDASILFFAVSGMVVVALGLLPPIFFRLPMLGRFGAYALGLVAFLTVAATGSTVNEAYERTPKGAAEAAAETQEAAAETQDADKKETGGIAEDHERYLADARRKVQRCINRKGQIPALVEAVKESLHNPRSFEHVGTEVKVVGDTGLPAVVMEYRGENGFGAIRTEAVSAFIVPGDCSVRAMKEYESGDFAAD